MQIRFAVLCCSMVKRLFVALDLPENLAGRLVELDPGMEGLRWTPAERLHVTLCFLGDVDEQAHAKLVESLAEVACGPFALRVKGCGCFAKHGGLVLWAGVDDPAEALPLLHRRVARAVKAAGLDPGPSRIQPHLTIARARHGKPAMVREFLDAHAGEEFGEFTVSGVTLYSSVLRSDGPDYHKEYRRSFSAPPA
ncbi:RNA 2',3'-cyclic phosphodiesterase [Luteolibacter soli]|uniref:RNA 2',3'-cyclic phosphodiesterase n=1 Tax=Luteolibacter soli TaxID=3135280 RepID=A0ABU9AX36_9BACT